MGFLNSSVLDWAIGIIFVYLLLAIICTTINEWIAGIAALRAKTLFKAITQLLDDPNPNATFLASFYKHPLILGMRPPNDPSPKAHPSYVSARTFATVVMDLATDPKKGAITFPDLETGAKNLPEGDVRTALLALLQNAGDLPRAQKNIEDWFDDSMERATGWYKRRTQIITVFVAAFLTIATNADTIKIGRLLWSNATLRATLVEKAKNRTATGDEATSRTTSATYPSKDDPLHPVFQPRPDELNALKPMLGWDGSELKDLKAWPLRLLGWFLSIAAISLGAPFWFDLLKKVMNVRNAGQKPEKSDDKEIRSAKQRPAPAGVGG